MAPVIRAEACDRLELPRVDSTLLAKNRIVDVHHETPAKEAAEKAQEKKEKTPTKH